METPATPLPRQVPPFTLPPDANAAGHLLALAEETMSRATQSHDRLVEVSRLHALRLLHGTTALWGDLARLGEAWRSDPLLSAAQLRDYLRDAQQRALLTADTLREAATAAQAHEDAGLKPVLAFDYDVVVEGTDLPRPVNYTLVRIRPPKGTPSTRADLRPWVIIDPRSGQGSGIGGFKAESEVGIALAEGYPVYFVIFSQFPEPGQTLADVTEAEVEFLRRIRAAHPLTGKPFVTGNCQGGWATMILAATHPDLIGPIVIAGVPLSPWAGRLGQNPLRYLGGWTGGAMPAQMLADLGGGLFDGAALVANFEAMNPGRDMWRKYADLFGQIDTRAADYIDFDRWWSGFYFMNAAEIRWIIENIFLGNRLARGLAVLDDGTRIELSRITSPLVVFASHGDAVSTVQQALRWIPDVWGSAVRIREAGRTIIYTTHASASHLSIFVSADVADENHRRIGSVIRTIEALPPGLYEMVVQDGPEGTTPEVRFEARETSAILALCDPPEADEAFAHADATADWIARGYDLFLGPWLRALTSGPAAQLGRSLHPLRMQNRILSDANPLMARLAAPAEAARAARAPVDEGNPFYARERLSTDIVARQLDLIRDLREAATEMGFLAVYAGPFWRPRAAPRGLSRAQAAEETAALVDVIAHVEHGGYAEAIVRMCVMLSRVGGQVRQDRIERFSAMLHARAPFSSMTPEMRRHLIDTQSQIVERAGPAAEAALMRMLRDDIDRYRAVNLVHDLMEFGPDSPGELIAAFEGLQRALRTRARDWRNLPDTLVP
jgi:tellurite resistance protein